MVRAAEVDGICARVSGSLTPDAARNIRAALDDARTSLRDAVLAGDVNAPELLTRASVARCDIAEQIMRLRLQGLARVHQGLASLQQHTVLDALLPAAVKVLAECCDFDRAVISKLRDSGWRAEAVWQHPDVDHDVATATAKHLTSDWIPLSRGVLEADLIRRRAAEVIQADDPRADKALMAATRSRAYVASPIMPSSRVIGFLQADCLVSGRPLTDHDRDMLWAFAQGFGALVERTVLLGRLRQQLDRARGAFAQAEAQIEQLAHDQVRLVRSEDPVAVVAGRAEAVFGVVRPERSSRRKTVLTARETELMELVAGGLRNGEIADRLLVSRETVKSNLRSVMRKLGASSRAEAVATFLGKRS